MMVDKLILGTVQLGMPYGINNNEGQPPESESLKILGEAYKNGIRVLDTAEAYGSAHRIIGNFHRLNSSTIFKVNTKISQRKDEETLKERISHLIKELAVDNLEAIMFHSFSVYRNYRDQINQLIELKNTYKIRCIGLSIYTDDEFMEVISDRHIDLIQLPFNLLDNFSIKGKLLVHAKAKGKIIHSRSTFLQGLFFKNIDDSHPVSIALRPQLMKLNEIICKEQISIEALALSYCLHQNTIDKVLIGVDSVTQLRANLTAANIRLKQNVIDEVNQIVTADFNLLNPSLWK